MWSRSSVTTTYVSAPNQPLEEPLLWICKTHLQHTQPIHFLTSDWNLANPHKWLDAIGLPSSSYWIYHLFLGYQSHSYWSHPDHPLTHSYDASTGITPIHSSRERVLQVCAHNMATPHLVIPTPRYTQTKTNKDCSLKQWWELKLSSNNNNLTQS